MRFQLIDTADWAVNYQLRVLTPQSNLDQRQTTIGNVLAGFNDLTKYGLYRTGSTITWNTPRSSGRAKRNRQPKACRRPERVEAGSRIRLRLAKTLIDPEVPLVGDPHGLRGAFGATQPERAAAGRDVFLVDARGAHEPDGREEKAWWLQSGLKSHRPARAASTWLSASR